jgi:hypothetical protein
VSCRRIVAIYGMEPQRADEYPTGHKVGQTSRWADGTVFTVIRIERREENMGTYGLLWFDIFYGDGDRVACSMQGTAVAEVHYERTGA